ncbi:hypothetical protein LC593_22930 [Nostoc sp. CHAB 5844]|nr:hypothetical protein [Nostoc sp. CHAB 5844]
MMKSKDFVSRRGASALGRQHRGEAVRSGGSPRNALARLEMTVVGSADLKQLA